MPTAAKTPAKGEQEHLPQPHEGMRIYELSILVPATMAGKEMEEFVKNIEGLLKEKNARILERHEWGKRGLAYKINKQSEGKYFMYICEINPDIIGEVSMSIGLEKNVLRHLVLSTDTSYEIIDWGARFREWIKNMEMENREKEEEKQEELKRIIVKKAAKKTKDDAEKGAKTSDGGKAGLEEKIEELISDEDLNL